MHRISLLFVVLAWGTAVADPCTCSVILKGNGQTADEAGNCTNTSAGPQPDDRTITNLQNKDVWYPTIDQPTEPWYACRFNT